MLFATLEQGQPSPQVLHLGSHSGTHLVSESLRKYTPIVIQKKSPKSVQNWSSFGTLLGSLGALHALPSPSKGASMTCSCPTWPPRASKVSFWDAFGTLGVPAKRTIAIVFCVLIQFHLGLKTVTLMHLRQQQITTCNVYTAIVLALHRLAAPHVPRTNLEF